MSKKQESALIIGATGLVGFELAKALSTGETYSRVLTVARKPVKLLSQAHEHYIVDFEHLQTHQTLFDADDLFICIGTTLKKAGSKDRFVDIDKGYAITAARLFLHNKGKRIFLVSAKGANAKSRIFYNRIKGETEAEMMEMGFESCLIFRPSLLLGDREEQRTLESFARGVYQSINALLTSLSGKTLGTKVTDLVGAMEIIANQSIEGNHIFENKDIKKISQNGKV